MYIYIQSTPCSVFTVDHNWLQLLRARHCSPPHIFIYRFNIFFLHSIFHSLAYYLLFGTWIEFNWIELNARVVSDDWIDLICEFSKSFDRKRCKWANRNLSVTNEIIISMVLIWDSEERRHFTITQTRDRFDK